MPRARLGGASVLVVGALLAAAPAMARADSRIVRVGEIGLYGGVTAGAAVSTAVNGLYLAVDEGSPALWRTSGYVFGGVALGLGAGMLVTRPHDSANLVAALAPLVLGTSSLVTALWVSAPDDVVGATSAWLPSVGPSWVGLGWATRF